MNEKQAEILISINETKNITETARILKLTQPTISFHMKNMEKEYGMKLFIHASGKIILSENGEILLHYAKRIIRLSQDARNVLESYNFKSRPLKIGASLIPGKYYLSEIIGELVHEYPQNPLSVSIHPAATILTMLEQLEIDLGFVSMNHA